MSADAGINAGRRVDGAMLRGVGVIAAFAALTGISRVIQDAAIAWRFGTGTTVDAYYFVLSLISWPVGVALSALTLLTAPAAASASQDGLAARKFRAELFGAVLLISVASAPLAWWILRFVAGGAVGGLEPATAAEAIAGVPGLVAAVPLGITAALLSALFVATQRHVLTLLEALPPLIVTALVLALPGAVLFWGTSVGAAFQVVAMMLILGAARELPRPRLGFSATPWNGLALGLAALLASQTLFLLVPMVDAFFAARLGDGMLTSLSYSNRLIAGLTGLAGLALQRAGLPLLTNLAAGDPAAARRAALRWAVAAGVVGAGMALVTWVVSDWMVSLLFERGRFTAGDREQVANLLRVGIWQAPALLAGMALATALASMRANMALMMVAAAGLCVKVILSFVLTSRNGAPGLQLATVMMSVATALLCWVALRMSYAGSGRS